MTKNIIFKILRFKKGETIMETLVSLLIMGLLITALLSIIRFSMVITGDALRNAGQAQGSVNTLITNANYTTAGTVTITIVPAATNPSGLTLTGETATQNVRLSADEDFAGAFIPTP